MHKLGQAITAAPLAVGRRETGSTVASTEAVSVAMDTVVNAGAAVISAEQVIAALSTQAARRERAVG